LDGGVRSAGAGVVGVDPGWASVGGRSRPMVWRPAIVVGLLAVGCRGRWRGSGWDAGCLRSCFAAVMVLRLVTAGRRWLLVGGLGAGRAFGEGQPDGWLLVIIGPRMS